MADTENVVQENTDINANQVDDWTSGGAIELVDESGEPVADVLGNKDLEPKAEPQPDGTPAEPAKPIPDKPEEPAAPQGFESQFYNKDESGAQVFDGQKGLDFLKKHDSFTYQTPFKPAEPKAGAVPAADAPPAWRTEVIDWGQKLRDTELAPLQNVYNALANAGLATEGIQAAFNSEYITREKDITNRIEERRMEFLDKSNREARTQSDDMNSKANLKSKSDSVQTMVARDLGGFENYNQLIFGGKDSQGKNYRGYGADIIDFLFDLTSKTDNMTADQYNQAYGDFWTKFSSDEKNVRMVTKLASGIFSMAQRDNMRKAYRAEWEKEKGAIRSGSTNNPNSGQVRGQVSNTAGLPNEIAQFLGTGISSV